MMFKKIDIPTDQNLLDIVAILTKANQILQSEYRAYIQDEPEFMIQQKDDLSPVTQADLKIHSFLQQELMRLSETPILSEEGHHDERTQWQKFWLLDPLDGTKEFIEKRPEFTINLSLVESSKTTFAAISVPEKEVIYIGYLDQVPLKFCTSSKTWFTYVADEPLEISSVQLGMSHRQKGKYDNLFLQTIEQEYAVTITRAGSAYKFCLMLEGEIDIYPRFHPTAEWDTSAGQCFLESIGGGLYSLNKKKFLYNQRSTLINEGFIAVTHHKYKYIAFDILESLI